MSITDLLNDIRIAGDHDQDRIIAKAEKQAQELIEQAQKEARQLQKIKTAELQKSQNQVRQQESNARRLHSQHRLHIMQQETIEEALQALGKALDKLIASPRYPAVLARLIEETTQNLDRDGEIRVNSSDLAFTQKTLAHLGAEHDLIVQADGSIRGGLVYSSSDGTINLTNTLDSRRQKLAAEIEQLFIEHLFP